MNKLSHVFTLLLVTLVMAGCSDHSVQTSTSTTKQRYSEEVIKAASISVDGEFTLLSDNKSVCLWNNPLNKRQYPCLTGLEAQLIEIVGISNSNKYFYTSNRVNVHLYDLASGRLVTVWSAGDNIINDIAMSANEQKLIFGFRSGQASIVSVISNEVVTFQPHRLDINSVSISADGSKAFTGSSDKNAVLWNTASGKALQTFKHSSRVNHVTMSDDANIAFTLDAISDRFFWLLKIGKQFSELATSIKFIEFNHSTFVHKNQWLISASPKQKFQLWRVKDGELLGEWQAFMSGERYRSSVLNVQLINAEKIASITSEGVFEIWPIKLQAKN